MSFEGDLEKTLENVKGLRKNPALMYWYRKCFDLQLQGQDEQSKVLEIGSGTSPLKHIYPLVKTSDILPVPELDYCLDVMEIDQFTELEDHSLDLIVMTNVLHHLKEPLEVLKKLNVKLKKGGEVVFVEPYFSMLSSFIYRFHHEPFDMNIKEAKLSTEEGPLTSSNQALPFLIFFRNKAWRGAVEENYQIAEYSSFSSISYFLTGGISHSFGIPLMIYKWIFVFDRYLAKKLPKLLSSFFLIRLKAK
jgi:SAM-dependent methyltransferase